MHYLEDNLDLLDGVTDEFKAQCLEMRELDNQIEKLLSEVCEESRNFLNVIKSLNEDERKLRQQKIKEKYRRIREMSEEKLAIAEFLELMLDKYQERIAKDLNEFKIELEADTPNITETIEKELCETIKNAYNQKNAKSLVISLSSNHLINNVENDISAEDSGFEDVKPSTSGNYRVNGNRYGLDNEKLSTLNESNRHQKRITQFASPINRHISSENSHWNNQQDFLPPPIKKKLYPPSAAASNITAYVNNSDKKRLSVKKDFSAEKKNSRLIPLKAMISSSNLVLGNSKHNSNRNGSPSHRDKSISHYFSGASKHDKISPHSSLSGLPRWSPSSSNYLNNNISVSAGSPNASTSTTPSPTPQSSSNPLFNRPITSQSYGYHQHNTSFQPSTSSFSSSASNNGSSNASLSMPIFAGGQESQYGRPVKLTSRVQQMLKDRHTHRIGRSLASNPYNSQAAGVRYNALTNFNEDEHRESGFRQRLSSNSQRRRRVIIEEDELEGSNSFSENNIRDGLNHLEEDLNNEGNIDDYDEENGEEDEDQDNNVWCICQQKSEGDMVACDNKSCPYEWFHYKCVGITAPPRGKWFCPICTKNARRSRSISLESH